MSMQANLLGLDTEKTKVLVDELNQLLAFYQVFYMNTRGYHWNIKGHTFFELHEKFEEIYTDLLTKIDEIAERILTLGFTPDHSFSKYLELSEIKEHKNATTSDECMQGLIYSFSLILSKERVILEHANEAQDEGTSAIMGDYIREQEKLLWMLNAYIANS